MRCAMIAIFPFFILMIMTELQEVLIQLVIGIMEPNFLSFTETSPQIEWKWKWIWKECRLLTSGGSLPNPSLYLQDFFFSPGRDVNYRHFPPTSCYVGGNGRACSTSGTSSEMFTRSTAARFIFLRDSFLAIRWNEDFFNPEIKADTRIKELQAKRSSILFLEFLQKQILLQHYGLRFLSLNLHLYN